MGVEWAAIGVLLAAGALCIGFLLGLVVGYAWRDRISRARRARVKQDLWLAEIDRAATTFAQQTAEVAAGPQVAMRTRTSGKHRKKPTKPKLEVVKSDVLQQPSRG
jgi:hypothetical protein